MREVLDNVEWQGEIRDDQRRDEPKRRTCNSNGCLVAGSSAKRGSRVVRLVPHLGYPHLGCDNLTQFGSPIHPQRASKITRLHGTVTRFSRCARLRLMGIYPNWGSRPP